MKLLITGEPGTGKSTLMRQIIAQAPASFWVIAEELRNPDGSRAGFQATTATGEHGVFAHKTALMTPHKVGSFFVDIAAIDRIFTAPIQNARSQPLLIIDEIGRMEMLSPRFAAAINQIFASSTHLIATIRQGDDWTNTYTKHPDAILLTLTEANRQQLADVILPLLHRLDDLRALTFPQQAVMIQLARQYAATDQYIQLRKLFKNAIRYVAEGRVKPLGEGRFSLPGLHGNHLITFDGQTTACDCDLFNGRNQFAGQPGECSHLQAVKMSQAS